MNRDVSRVIDANVNRVTEGLRVIEDIYRYCRDDAAVQQRLKLMRHRIASETGCRPLVASRDARNDVGFASQGSLEEKRSSLRDILRSNMKRVQEGLRVLEEVLKLDSLAASRTMKEIRYECYEVEREIVLAERKILPKGLFLILDSSSADCEALARTAVSEGIAAVGLACGSSDSAGFLRTARIIQGLTENSETRLIVLSRPDIALLSGADGLHLSRLDITPEDARALAGDRIMIGLSTHTKEQVEKAQDRPVDYIAFGPVFPSPAHDSSARITGAEALRTAASLSKLPVVAFGGITRERLDDLPASLCSAVASMSAVSASRDPAGELRAIHSRIGELS